MAAIALGTEHRQDDACPGVLPAGKPMTVTAPFQPPDPDTVSEAIPAFFIGRNGEGFWVARDVKGTTGGIFLLKNSALAFAKQISQPEGCATIFPSHRFELDLANNGNPFALQLGSLMRFRRRVAASIGNVTAALKHRLEGLHFL